MFRVIWRHAVVDALMRAYTEVFARAGDTGSITRAAEEIERSLAHDPAAVGESRGRYERVGFFGPLTVTFEIFEEERTVFVLSLTYREPRRS